MLCLRQTFIKTKRSTMAEYQMQELTLPNEEGKKVTYPRIKLWGQVDLEYIARHINYASTFTPGDIIGLVRALTEAIASEMAQGNSVKIDGLGIFTPSLGLRPQAEEQLDLRESEGKEYRVSAASIYLRNINFRADKELIQQTGQKCRLSKSEWKARRSSRRYTAEQRLQLAQDYLKTHPMLRVKDYCALTGLLRNAAASELKLWSETPGSGIDHMGTGSHKVYVRKEQ